MTAVTIRGRAAQAVHSAGFGEDADGESMGLS